MAGCGIDLGDGGMNLIDLRFADDLLVFAKSSAEASFILDRLVEELSAVGLILNAAKTFALTTEAQPAANLQTPGGIEIKVLPREEGHKWLGCMLSTAGVDGFEVDAEYHLQAASRAFYASRWILRDKRTSIIDRLRFFCSVVTSVACFGAGHRAFRRTDCVRYGVEFRRLARQVVGPPPDTDWSKPWHEILHAWHVRLASFVERAGVRDWTEEFLNRFYTFAQYVAELPEDRWVTRVRSWRPRGPRVRGRPASEWACLLEDFARRRRLGSWQEVAADKQNWEDLRCDAVAFMISAAGGGP